MELSIYNAESFLEALKNKNKISKDEAEKIFGSEYEKNMNLLEGYDLYRKENDSWIKVY